METKSNSAVRNIDQTVAIQNALTLVDNSTIATLGTNREDGHPCIRAMLKIKNDGFNIWFSTNTSSPKIKQIKIDPRACVYFYSNETYEGLRLFGNVIILNDLNSRKLIWRTGFEKYYKLGVNDPDYTVLLFNAENGDHYHKLSTTSFKIKTL